MSDKFIEFVRSFDADSALIESIVAGYSVIMESESYEVPRIGGKSKLTTNIPPNRRSLKNLPRDSKRHPTVRFQDWLEMDPCGHGVGRGSDGKWYGWSHRAIFGFEAGMKVKKGDITYRGQEFTIKDDAHAKKIAERFSDDVS